MVDVAYELTFYVMEICRNKFFVQNNSTISLIMQAMHVGMITQTLTTHLIECVGNNIITRTFLLWNTSATV